MAVLYLHHPRFLHFFYSIPSDAVFLLLDGSSVLFQFVDIFAGILDVTFGWTLPDTARNNSDDLANNAGRDKTVFHTIGM